MRTEVFPPLAGQVATGLVVLTKRSRPVLVVLDWGELVGNVDC